MEVEALTGHLQAKTKNRAWWILTGGEGENDVTRSADRYLDSGADANGGPFTVERVARKLQEHIGGHEPPEAFVPWVKRCLEHMRVEQEVAEKIG
jgi:hypothetical protein